MFYLYWLLILASLLNIFIQILGFKTTQQTYAILYGSIICLIGMPIFMIILEAYSNRRYEKFANKICFVHMILNMILLSVTYSYAFWYYIEHPNWISYIQFIVLGIILLTRMTKGGELIFK
jgi:F0F1-type ATP synthase assembly protein I